MHVVDAGARGLNHADRIVFRAGVAGDQAVRQALHEAPSVFAVEHAAEPRRIFFHPPHLDRLIDVFEVRRAVKNLHAIGLFAAIPAVVAYNRFAREIDKIAIALETFIEEFSNILQRNLTAHVNPTSVTPATGR